MLLKQELIENGNLNSCLFCRGKVVLDYENGEKICSSCGLVVGYDYSLPDQVSRSSNLALNSQSRIPSADIRLGQTFIDGKNVDSRGKRIPATGNLLMMRKLDRLASFDDSDRRIGHALDEIRRIAERLGVGQAVEHEANSIYYKAFKQGLIRGRSVQGICAAAIYVACRKLAVPRLLEDIADASNHGERKYIAPYCKLLIRRLGIHLDQLDASEYLDSIARNACISPRTQREALSILSLVEGDPKLSGKRPISLAAAALYIASRRTGEHTSQLRIASGTNLTPTTVRKTSLAMEQILRKESSESDSGDTMNHETGN